MSDSKSRLEKLVVQVTLLIVLAGLGWLVIERTPVNSLAAIQATVDANERLLFAASPAVDLEGQLFDPFRSATTTTIAAVVLRAALLESDLKFWQKVHSLVAPAAHISVIGYCDGSDCVQLARSSFPDAALPMMAFAGVIDSQALLNADANGGFIVLAKGKPMRAVPWRDSGLVPEGAAVEISR